MHPLLGISTNDPLGLGITWRNTISVSDLVSLVDQDHVPLPGVCPAAGYVKMASEASLKFCAPRVLREFKLEDFFVQNDMRLSAKEDRICIMLELQCTGSHERRGDRTDFVSFRIRTRKDGVNNSMQLNALGCLRLTSSTSSKSSTPDRHSTEKIEASSSSGKIIKTLPMSFGQSGFWFMSQLVGDPTFLNGTISFLITTKHNLNVEALKQNVRDMAKQHEGLRTAFFTDPTSNQPVQAVLYESPLHLEVKKITSPDQVRTEIDAMNRSVYDITQGKTLRLLLLSESPTRHHLIVGYHHINIDGMSVIAITDHLRLAYGGQKLPPPFQQNEFALRQRERVRTGQYAKDVAFWKKEFQQLPDLLPILPLSPNTALRSSRPTTRTTYRHVSASVRLNTQTTAKIVELKKQGVIQSPFAFYLTVFRILLGRLAESDDICIGVASANRQNDPGCTDSIGIFLNPFALRLRGDLNKSFSQLLQDTKAKVLAGLKHSAVPFDVVLDEVGAVRHPSHSPLFQAFINYIPVIEDRAFGVDGIMHNKEYEIGQTIYDIMLAVIDPPTGNPWISIMVQEELYTEQEARILLECFINMTEAFVNDIHLPGRAPNMFDQEAVQQANKLGQGPSLDMDFGCLIGQLDGIASKNSGQIALRDTTNRGSVLSYADMMTKSIHIAHALSSSGLAPKCRIGVLQEPTADWICSMLGIWRFGGSYVPLEVTQGPGRLESIVHDAGLGAVLVHDATRTLCSEIFGDQRATIVVNIGDVMNSKNSANFSNFYKATPEDEAIVLYTSGSTGAPKGISLPHRMITNTINGFLHTFPMRPQTVLQQIALSFDVSWWQALVGLATGGSVVVAGKDSRRDPAALTSLIASEGVTLTLAVPSEAMSWLQHGVDHHQLRQSSWEFHISAGEAIGPNLMEILRHVNKPDLRFLNAYGPAETIIPHVYEVPYRDPNLDLSAVIPIGKVQPNYSVYIMDKDNHPLPAGVPGQIVIGGAGVASGYIGQPELTASRFPKDSLATPRALANGWARAHLSGDRGYMLQDGTFIALGRINGDTQVKLRGQRFELREVEAALVASGRGDILEAVCHVRQRDGKKKDDGSSAILVAHVVLKPGILDPDSSLRELADSQSLAGLPQYMRPSVIIPLPFMPLSHHGKVDRKLLSKMPLKTQERTRTENTSLGEMEAIWREVLVDIVSPSQRLDQNSDFFLVGGNSLLLIHVKNKIKERTGRDISLPSLFEGSTLGKMTATVGAGVATSSSTSTSTSISTNTTKTNNETQARMKKIWLSVLGDIIPGDPNTIGPDSDFFLIGGNSLLLISIQREVNKEFGLLLPLASMFEASTLRKMSALLEATVSASSQAKLESSPAATAGSTTIDWQDEVAFRGPVSADFLAAVEKARTSSHPLTPSDSDTISHPITVVLTGSTGFLGRHLLERLASDSRIARIHCLAVRNAAKMPAHLLDSPKITIHPGDLRASNPAPFGLSPETVKQIFSSPNLSIIHNGADVSFLRGYRTLRAANLVSTKILADLAIKHFTGHASGAATSSSSPAILPHFHFISTAGVSQLLRGRGSSTSSDLYEEPLVIVPSQGLSLEQKDGVTGYVASKYASEKFLENANAAAGLPVTIHRPSYITGHDAPELDVMHNILLYAQKLRSVPRFPPGAANNNRWLQFVGIDEVAGDIMSDVVEPVQMQVQFRNHCGEEKDWVRLEHLGSYLESKEGGQGGRFASVEFDKWIEDAGRMGMPVQVRGYLIDLMAEGGNNTDGEGSGGWVYPRVLKGWRGGGGGGPWRRAGRL
ncbi:putative hybrid NRPS/PKS enzyme [Cladorrhinum samala]|uniref:Hybrid NRPS/PKS enzyme n=1 Tax=Cladorrhinum samala TaxID=585594 RepID=A0AAV9HBJ4_9PEZI|nr:putative hybrid NRPS/PKS enzyme [Cladorrhinum samala]